MVGISFFVFYVHDTGFVLSRKVFEMGIEYWNQIGSWICDIKTSVLSLWHTCIVYISGGYETEFYSWAQNNVYLALFLLDRI